MVRVSRFSPPEAEVENNCTEFNRLLVDPINNTALMSHNENNALRAVSIESTQQKDPAKMATAADALGSIAIDATHLTMSVTDPTAWATAMNNLGIVPVGLAGHQLVSDPLCVPGFDPSLSMLTGITPINPMMASMGLMPPPPIIKEIIHCKSSTLFPPNPNLPPPSTRERPPGCKTVFVGGLPENATEEIIQEVFEQCGDITAIRKSKKNFCHIRFSEEFMVEKAIYLSGYRMRLGSSTDKKDSGRLHVDFAQARDDMYEWECKQRMLAREERHRRRLEVDMLRPPSPPAIMHYSEHEATMLAEKLKADDGKFSEATSVLLTWIERGEVNRRSSNQFYSLIQSANSHVRRLMNEKAAHEEKLEQAKEIYKKELYGILTQLEQIVAVFNASSRQKAWDHFSKAQRKNIDLWRKHCEELRNAHSEQLMCTRSEEEMEMSDDDSSDVPPKRARVDDSALAAQAYALKEENDSLRCQLDAYRNEVELLKQESGIHARTEESVTKDQQLKFLEQTMQNMQQQFTAMQEELNLKKRELEKAKEEQTHAQALVNILKEQLKNAKETTESNNHDYLSKENGTVSVAVFNHDKGREEDIQRQTQRSEKEALLIGIISTFLNVHPFGANIEYLWSYLQQLDSRISANEIETLLMRLPRMFKQELTGVGATLEKKWKFCAFEGIKSS